MNLQNQPPIFVPREHWAEVEKLSKAALMDIAWDFALQITGRDNPTATMEELRARAELIVMYRKRAKDEVTETEPESDELRAARARAWP